MADIIARDDNTSKGTVTMTLKNENGNLSYNGIYKDKLSVGKYTLSLDIDKEKKLYYFVVNDSNKVSISLQSNLIDSREIRMRFPSNRIANWYCGEQNAKIKDKLRIKIFNMPKAKGEEIYNFDSDDFTINGDLNSNYRSIQFNDAIKKELDNLYVGYIYISIVDENGKEYEPHKADEPSVSYYSSNINALYVRNESSKLSSIGFSISNNDSIVYMIHNASPIVMGIVSRIIDIGDGISISARPDFDKVSGSDTSFPATVTITDWYSLKPIKTINVPNAEYTFTESDVADLSSEKLYRFFLQGNDGSASNYEGYIKNGNNDKPNNDNLNNNDTNNDNNNNNGNNDNNNNGNNNTSNGISGGGVSVSYANSTSAPTSTPQPTVTPQPMLTPTPVSTPIQTVTPQPTTTLAPTAVPEETALPQPTDEPENITNETAAPTEVPTELKIKNKNITLKEGEKARIKITSELNTDVVYKSLNPSIATVNKNGVITAKKNGKATITVNANEKVHKVIVTVKATKQADNVKLNKNFKLSKSKVAIKKGHKFKIKKATGLSGKITYRSLNEKIASVSAKGVIKAKSKGKTTIKITKGKTTIKLKVTVKK